MRHLKVWSWTIDTEDEHTTEHYYNEDALHEAMLEAVRESKWVRTVDMEAEHNGSEKWWSLYEDWTTAQSEVQRYFKWEEHEIEVPDEKVTREHVSASLRTLKQSDAGQRAIKALSALMDNSLLDLENQRAVTTLVRCFFGGLPDTTSTAVRKAYLNLPK